MLCFLLVLRYWEREKEKWGDKDHQESVLFLITFLDAQSVKKSVTIKTLFMYSDGAKEQRRKQEEQRSSSLLEFSFPLQNRNGQGWDGSSAEKGNHLIAEKPQTKGSCLFIDPQAWGIGRHGKVPSQVVKSTWVKAPEKEVSSGGTWARHVARHAYEWGWLC